MCRSCLNEYSRARAGLTVCVLPISAAATTDLIGPQATGGLLLGSTGVHATQLQKFLPAPFSHQETTLPISLKEGLHRLPSTLNSPPRHGLPKSQVAYIFYMHGLLLVNNPLGVASFLGQEFM